MMSRDEFFSPVGHPSSRHGKSGQALHVISSRFEEFSNTLAEAMTHGRPAVRFDCDTGPRGMIVVTCERLPLGDEAGLMSLTGDAALREVCCADGRGAGTVFIENGMCEERSFVELTKSHG